MNFTRSQNGQNCRVSGWRVDAASIVESLFPVCSRDKWDLLLDLRQELLKGANWSHTLDLFLTCREALEHDHYLPFYRLRRLLNASLQLETDLEAPVEVKLLADFLRVPHTSLASIKKAIRRELFEHRLNLENSSTIPVRVVERS